jgi:uncharacterized membrane protein
MQRLSVLSGMHVIIAAELALKLKYSLDLVLAALFSLLLIPVVFTDSLAARLAIGVPFLLFVPGHALLAAFFPDRERLSAVERLAYAVGSSIGDACRPAA